MSSQTKSRKIIAKSKAPSRASKAPNRKPEQVEHASDLRSLQTTKNRAPGESPNSSGRAPLMAGGGGDHG
jgi:hypothetical protein